MPSARSRTDVLIVAAHSAELSGLSAVLGRRSAGSVRGLRIRVESVGVGLPAAAVGTMRALSQTRPRCVVLLGSCGRFAPSALAAAPGLALALPDALQLVDAATAAGRAAYPEPMPIRIAVDRALRSGLARGVRGALRGTLATTPGITTDDTLASELATSSGCSCENLEALSVGLACASHGVRFAALLVVTNQVGSLGRQQWLANHRAAAERGAAHLLAWLERGAPGLEHRSDAERHEAVADPSRRPLAQRRRSMARASSAKLRTSRSS